MEQVPQNGAPGGRSYLLVLEGGSSSMFRLRPHAEVVIGRGESAGLRLRDPSVSRTHARLTFGGGEITLADLGSRNGCRVNGERVTGPRPLASGDVISIGAATLVLHHLARAAAQSGLLELVPFRQRLEDEIERSLRYGRPFTVAHVDLAGVGSADRLRIASAVENVLRNPDVIAMGPGHLQVLLPETPLERAEVPLERLLRALAAIAPRRRAGVASYPTDGCDADALLASARTAARAANVGEVASPAEVATGIRVGEHNLLVADAAMGHLVVLLERVASGDAPLLLYGEPGVGKALLSAALHQWSARREQPFVALSCADAEGAAELRLFGCEGAAAAPGALERAAGGTLLLEDVELLSPSVQLRLARLLGEKRFARAGSDRDREIDVRVVAATTCDLAALVEAGRFREDLFQRLGEATLVIPPLRDRRRDLAVLAQTFLREASLRRGRAAPVLSAGAMQALSAYAWPGNVGELRAVIEELAAGAGEGTLEVAALPDRFRIEEQTATMPNLGAVARTLQHIDVGAVERAA